MADPSDDHLSIFLPWLRLEQSHSIAGIEFWPLRDDKGMVSPPFRDAADALAKILSSYRDRRGAPLKNCVIAVRPNEGWSLGEDDLEPVRWAASLLFLASWACNEYFPRFSGPYVTSEDFRAIGQRFSGPMPQWIALVSRRRDGSKWDGGYKHGEVNFSLPQQCSARDAAEVDTAFLTALDAASSARSAVMERLSISRMFVQLANADDDAMTLTAEALLMGSAFEQLFGGPSSAYKLARKFGHLFGPFGSVSVADAQQARTGIEIDTRKSEYAAAQPSWWVHRKWFEELYDVRSKATHRGHHQGRTWGWGLGEHLLMAAYVFPLTVKLLLAREGHYTITDADRNRLIAVDKLLAVRGWDQEQEEGGPTRWHEVISSVRLAREHELLMAKLQETFPDLWKSDDST